MTSLNVFMSRGFMSRGLRSGAVVFAAATCLALAGCAGGAPADPGTSSPAPTTSATSDPSPSPTPTPSAVYKPADASGPAQNVPVPVLPEVARTETKEGLEAFAKYWFEQVNYAYETGNISGVEGLTSPNCEFCSNITSSLTTNYQEGRWLAGGHISVPAASTTFERGPDGNYHVILQLQQETITYYQPGGGEFRTATKPSNSGNVLLVGFESGTWRVNGLHPLG
jgi:Family of unknown function (DUF6318)